jgi:hypothetical protein
MDLILAREDGIVEVYVYDSADQPYLKYTYVKLLIKKLFKLKSEYFFHFLLK